VVEPKAEAERGVRVEVARTRAEAAESAVESKLTDADERARQSEERVREVEAEAAATISEVRQAAADWLRDQTKAIRAEAEREARAGDAERDSSEG
jgi:hypothetical protein